MMLTAFILKNIITKKICEKYVKYGAYNKVTS